MDAYIGMIMPFAGNFAIKNWAFCNGQLLAISQNTALFSIIGTYYGGNGTSSFALPDLRGRTVISMGQGPGLANYNIGQSAGTENTTLLTTNLPSHAHAVAPPVNTAAATATSPANAYPGVVTVVPPRGVDAQATTVFSSSSASGQTMAPYATGPVGNSLPFSTLQPYLTMNYLICVYGIFPSRN